MVERYSGYTLIARAENNSSDAVTMALLKRMVPTRDKVKTLTYDWSLLANFVQGVSKFIDSLFGAYIVQ